MNKSVVVVLSSLIFLTACGGTSGNKSATNNPVVVKQLQAAQVCTTHKLDWSQYANLNNPGPHTESVSDIDGSGIDMTVNMPTQGRDDKHVNSSSTTFPVVASFMGGNPEVYRYWGQDDIGPNDVITYNFSEEVVIDKFMFGGHRPPAGKFGYGILTFWDGPNGTGNKVVSSHENGAGSATVLPEMVPPTTEAINVLPFTSSNDTPEGSGDNPANYPTTFLSTTDEYAMVTYDSKATKGSRTFTALDMGGVAVRSMTWVMYTSDVDVSDHAAGKANGNEKTDYPAGTGSKSLADAEAGIQTGVNMSGYIGNFEFDKCIDSPTVSIGSVVWEDADADGFQGSSEPKIAGATVTLLMEDPNNAGTYIAATNADGGAVTPITTTADGKYFFDNLAQGRYKVQVTPPAGYTPTPNQTATDDNGAVENDSNIAANPSTNVYESAPITLALNEEKEEADSEVGDDADGTKGSDEDKSGDMTVDFGFVKPTPPAPTVSIGSVVWEDADSNGTQGSSEPKIAGATVMLLMEDPANAGSYIAATDVDGSAVGSVTTLADGKYYFDNLAEGNYKVKVTPPAGYTPTPTQNATDDNGAIENDSNIAGSPSAGDYESAPIALTVGGEKQEADSEVGDDADGATGSDEDKSGDMTVDFGFVKPTVNVPMVKIGDRVWIETDNDGDASNGAPVPVVGAVVTATSTTDGTVYTDTTDSNGNYLINVPANADYVVTVSPPAGTVPTANSNDNSVSDTTSEDDKSHDGSGTSVSVGTVDNLTLDFGFTPATTVKLGNRVWIETDNDGDASNGTPVPVVGAIVTATASDGTKYTGTTDGSGLYLIDVPQNDTYVVTVDPTTIPAGNAPSFGSNDSSVPDETAENDKTHNGNGTTVDITTVDNLTLDFGYTPSVKIGNRVWTETDNDGIANAGSTPVVGALVTATAPDGTTYTATTDAQGEYLIDVPMNQDYIVTVTPPAGYTPSAGSDDTTAGENDQTHDGQAGTTVSVQAVDNLTVDFGFVPAAVPPASGEPIPTLSEWALMMLVMMLGLFGYRQGLVRKD